MKYMKKTIVFLIAFLITAGFNISTAQVKNGYHDKLAALYEEGQYQDCAFKAERMLLKEKYKSDPEVYLYLAMCYNKIHHLVNADPTLLYDDPELEKAYNLALKYAIDAKKRDRRGGEFFPDNNDILDEVVYSGLPMADQMILEKKYSKAVSLYRKFLRIVNNTHITFIKGVLDLYLLDRVSARESIEEFFEAAKANELPNNENTHYLMQKGFVLYYDFLMQEDSVYLADSAKQILRMGLKYFPDDYEINQRLFPPKQSEQ